MSDITVKNVLSLLKNHTKYPKFYSKRLPQEIEFVSSHFSELCEERREELKNLDIEILQEIINHDHLRIKDEDQLLKFINELYSKDVKYSILYEYVYFVNVTSNMMNEFIEIFDINDISNQLWHQISTRLTKEISTKDDNKERYENKNISRSISFPMTNDQSFSGIINYLKKQTNNNIENKIEFSSSSSYNNARIPIKVTEFENKDSYFYSNNEPNSWISFHFKNHQIIPTNYTIGTYGNDGNPHPKSWVIECSNDSQSWEIIDQQNECPYLQKGWIVHTFNINKSNSKSYQYIRMRLTGKTKRNDDRLLIDSFEIYGTLI